MEEKSLAYFSSINPLAKKFIDDERKIKVECGSDWECWSCERREKVVDDFLIHSLVKNRYNRTTERCYPESFPRLAISSGEKIVVDFENDCWTWQDEHSGPFSWKTKSQQDLSLKDLEPDELSKSKSSSKSRHLHTEAAGARTKHRDISGKPGGVSKRIWDSPFHVGERKSDSGYPSSQDSKQSSYDDVRQCLDLTVKPSDTSTSEEENDIAHDPEVGAVAENKTTLKSSAPINKPTSLKVSQKSNSFTKILKSPSKSPILAKLPLSPNFDKKSKTPNDDTSMNLIVDKKGSSEGQDNEAFIDPLEGEESLPMDPDNQEQQQQEFAWSHCVEESSSDNLSSGPSSPSRRLLPREPESVEMIRGLTDPDFSDPSLGGSTGVTSSANHSLLTERDEADLPKTGFDFLDNW